MEETTAECSDELVVLREILMELRELRGFAERAAGFLDNPVKRYRESMRRAKSDRAATD
jgi:hypothetical protein